MGASTVTGSGHGAAEGPLRTFTNLDWARKIRALDATQIGDGSVTTQQFEYLNGLTGPIQEQIDEIAAFIAPENEILVAPNAGVTSIATAADSIIDSSSTNRYVIRVSPGTYTEPEITLPPYVYVVGEHIDAVVVKPDGNHHIFVMGNRSGIVNITISNSESGYAGVYSEDIGSFALLHKVTIKDCDYGVYHTASSEDSYLFLEYVDFTDCNTIIKSTATTAIANLSIENIYFEYTTSNSANAVIVDGDAATIEGSVMNCVGVDRIGNGFLVTNGGRLIINSAAVKNFNRGFYADTNGSNPFIKLSDISFGVQDYNNINIEIANTTASGHFDGYSEHDKTFINKSNNFFIANKDERTIVVAKKGGDFDSIKAAVDSITDSSYDNRYNVYVGPGVYYEDTITCKNYVAITGDETRSTIIELNDGNDDLFVINSNVNVTLRKLLLRPNPSGNSAVKYYGGVVRLNQIRFGTSDDPSTSVAVDAYESQGEENSLNIADCSTARACNLPLLFKFADDGTHDLNVTLSDFISNDTIGGLPNIAEIGLASGSSYGGHTEVQLIGCTFIGDGNGCGFKAADGCDVHIMGCTIEDFNIGVHITDQGAGPELEAVGSLIYDNATKDVWVQNSSAVGALNITATLSKIDIISGADIAVMIQNSEDGSLAVSGDYFQGQEFADITNLTDAMTKGPELGVSSGGAMTVAGLTVTVAAGTGYLHHIVAGEPHVQFIEWAETEVAIPANSNYNIYVDIDGQVLKTTAIVDFFTTIFIGRAVTDATDVIMLVDTYRDAVASGTKYDRLFRLYLGPVYRSGSIVTSTRTLSDVQITGVGGQFSCSANSISTNQLLTISGTFGGTGSITGYSNPTTYKVSATNGSTTFTLTEEGGAAIVTTAGTPTGLTYTLSGLNLHVTQGDYAFTTATFQPAAVTAPSTMTFATWYRNGSWYTITTGQTQVPNDKYDDGDGILHDLTDNYYVKHALYTQGTGASTKYFLVYGQGEFDSEEAAIAGDMPATPSPLTISAVCIAGLVVKKGASVIAQILDQRPTLVTRTNTITSTLVHGNLTGLDADDHPQYLLASGVRAFTGNVDVGGYAITNVGNVDGVDISGHQSRHLPNGLDALTTAAPTSNLSAISTNSVGTQNSLARSDHWHAITAYSDGTAGGLVKLDGNGDFTANEITANLVGDVNGDVVGNVEGNLTGNVISSNTAGTVLDTSGVTAVFTGDVTGDLTGDVTGNVSGTAANITGLLAVANGGTNSSTALSNNRVMISGSGAIVENAVITANRALASNASGLPVASVTTATELGYVSGVTSAIQTQITALVNGKQPSITGAATTITNSDLTADRALISDGSGKVAVSSTVSSTELGYLDGVTSAIQTQLNGKESTIALTTNRAVISNGTTGALTVSATTATELGYVSGVTSAIQTQLNAKSAIEIQTSTTATTSLTTVANQRVVVQVRAMLTTANTNNHTITLAYGGVTKDSIVVNVASGDVVCVYLQYSETPGAATANLTLTTSPGSLGSINYMITKIL